MGLSESPSTSQVRRGYAAFISYRHADNRKEGQRWAEWLHHALETYDVPRDLVGASNQRGERIPATLYPVFRDEEELPADADLSQNIRRALENSRTLIVICSPGACESRFVADEITTFKELGKSDRVFALIVDGEPNASDDNLKQAQFGPRLECFPEPLRRGTPLNQTGITSIDWQARAEPIAADVRPGGRPEPGYTSASAYRSVLEKIGTPASEIRQQVRAYKERLDLARLKLIAGILGVPLGTLRNRDAIHRARRARRVTTIFGAITTIAVLAGVFAWIQARVAGTQRVLADGARLQAEKSETAALKNAETARQEELAALTRLSENYLDRALALLAGGDRYQGIANLTASLRANPGNPFAADRLLFELNYGDWLLPSKVDSGSPARSFPKVATESFKGSDAVEIPDGAPEIKRADAILDVFGVAQLFLSRDKRWAVALPSGEEAAGDAHIGLLDWGQGAEIKTKGLAENSHITGLPAFDLRRLLLWLFTPHPFDPFRRDEPLVRAVDLSSGKAVLEEQFPFGTSILGVRPVVSSDGGYLILRYEVLNRPGQILHFFELSGSGANPSLRHVASNIVLQGELVELADNGLEVTVQTETAVVVYALDRHIGPSGPPDDKPKTFRLPVHRDGKIEAFGADGRLKVNANSFGNVVVSDVTTGDTISRFESEVTRGEGGRHVGHVEFSSDSRWLLVWGQAESSGYRDTEIYDPLSGRLLYPRFRHRSYGLNPAGSAIKTVAKDGRTVELINGQTMQVRFAEGAMPEGFAELVEGITGTYVDDRGVFNICGTRGARLPATAADLQRIISALDPTSPWTAFAKKRFLTTPTRTQDRNPATGLVPSSVSSFPQAPMPGEEYPQTRLQLLTLDEIKNWAPEKLQHAINEMYARYGAFFKNPKTQRVFSQLSWYRPAPNKTFDEIESHFSDIERQNLQTLGAARNTSRPAQSHLIRQAIRNIDLNDLTYHDALKSTRRKWPAENLRYFKAEPIYGELTGDANEDAAVVVRYRLAGEASTPSFSQVFVYTAGIAGPVLLADLEGGDRAYGGIESVRINGGQLMVARYRPSTADACMSCYGFIETTYYNWNGSQLVSGNVEVTKFERKN